MISPDGRRLAVTILSDDGLDVWVADLELESLRPLTTSGQRAAATWSPDGRLIAYGSTRGPDFGILVRAADGSGDEQRLVEDPRPLFPTSWSPDGSTLTVTRGGTAEDIYLLDVEENAELTRLVEGPDHRHAAAFSPDGRWIAYCDWASGVSAVRVRPASGKGSMIQVADDGSMPLWSPDGRELYFLTGGRRERLMVTEVEQGSTLSFTLPRRLFEHPFGGSIGLGLRRYDVSRDGKRFLYAEAPDTEAIRKIHVVLGWTEDIRSRLADR